MIDTNNYQRKKRFLDRDVIRESIHEFCHQIILYSPEILQFIFRKNGIVSEDELIQNHPKILRFYNLAYSIDELYLLVVEGRSQFAPSFFENDERINAVVRSEARPIFMEEAQMMLQDQECYSNSCEVCRMRIEQGLS